MGKIPELPPPKLLEIKWDKVLPGGTRIQVPKETPFLVPKGGGVYLGKNTLTDIGYNRELTDYYLKNMKEQIEIHNRNIFHHNREIEEALAVKPPSRELSWSLW